MNAIRTLALAGLFIPFAATAPAAPSVFPTGVTLYRPDSTWNGYTVLSRLRGPDVVVIDMNGRVVKQWTGFNNSAGGPARILPNGEVIAAHVASGKWRELSTLKRYLDITVELLKEEGKGLVAGANSIIAASATVSESILWDNVEVGAGARVHRAVLADNVKISANEVIENAVVVPRSLVEGKKPPEKALPGRFQGESFIVPL
jgi:hypothetical protein